MKSNQRNRYGNRYNNGNVSRSARPQIIFRNTSLESSGPCGKLRGTALQLTEKYQVAAKDALIQNDEVLAETCLQYADHYMRIQAQAILNEQNRNQQQRPVVVQPVADETVAPETIARTGELKVVDLSVPVADMEENQKQSEKGQRKKCVLRSKKTTAQSDKTEPEKN